MKIRKITAIVLTFVLCFGVLTVAFADESSGVPEGYTPVYTAEDLYNIRNDLDGKYILMNDIDLSVYENWEPIGTYNEPFSGELNGNNKTIENLKIAIDTDEKIAYAALFGTVSSGKILNLALKECSVDVKAISDTVWGICASGLVSLGNRESIIENCIVSGDIAVNSDKKICVGGIASRFSGTITNCCNLASVYAYVSSDFDCDYMYIGGIAGEFSGLLEKSSNHGDVEAEYNYPQEYKGFVDLGGIAGNSMSGGAIDNCYNVGTVTENTNQAPNLGGISGYSATVTNSHNYGTLIFSADESYAGGITGTTEFWFEDAWGGNGEKINCAELKNCFYSNDVDKSTGYFDEKYITNVAALSKEEFRSEENFTGFDFDGVWFMDEEAGYPVLQNQPVLPENIPERPTTTESTTEPTSEPSTEPDSESTTEPSTEPSSEPADSSTEPSTEPSSEPSDDECPLANLWIVKAINWLLDSVWSIIKSVYELISL